LQIGTAFRRIDRPTGRFRTASLYHTREKTHSNILNKSSRIVSRRDATPVPASTYQRQAEYVRLTLE
jgi:hypothetical protein